MDCPRCATERLQFGDEHAENAVGCSCDRDVMQWSPAELDPLLALAYREFVKGQDNIRQQSVASPANRSIFMGLLMMIAAVVWFLVGLAGYYASILLIVGLITFAKGLIGGGSSRARRKRFFTPLLR
jgi:cation transport ATPase